MLLPEVLLLADPEVQQHFYRSLANLVAAQTLKMPVIHEIAMKRLTVLEV